MRVSQKPEICAVNFSNKSAKRTMIKSKQTQDIFEKSVSFEGTPLEMPKRKIRSSDDAILQWELCKSAKYFDIHDDKICPRNSRIRDDNYEFLDQLSSEDDMGAFVDYFKRFTGFPDVEKVSKKMTEHFEGTINKISKSLNSKYETENFDVIFWGFDPTCSVGRKKALPGSDLDKAYIVLSGKFSEPDWVTSYDLSEQEVVDAFKGELWDKLDQRLVSINKPDTFPEVITIAQLRNKLACLDKKAEELIEKNGEGYYKDPMNTTLEDEVTAARFNIDVAKKLSTYGGGCTKEEAKNLAFLIEILRENHNMKDITKRLNGSKGGLGLKKLDVAKMCESSPFFRLSNVTQVEGWKNKDCKSKLDKRQQLGDRGDEVKELYTTLPLLIRMQIRYQMGKDGIESYINGSKGFNGWSIYKQYEFVKDIIRATSNNQGTSYSSYFDNPYDIEKKYTPLINMLTG